MSNNTSAQATDTDQVARLFAAEMEATGTVDPDAAEAMGVVAGAKPQVVKEVTSQFDPAALAQRVALHSVLIDDSPSMGTQISTPDGGTISLIDLALRCHDVALKTIGEQTKDEAVNIIASASWLNGGINYPFTQLAEAPMLAGHHVHLHGGTPLWRRFAETLTGFGAQLKELDDANKTTYGMAGLFADGEDTDFNWFEQMPLTRRIVTGLRRTRTILPYAVHVGHLPEEGEPGFHQTRNSLLTQLERTMGTAPGAEHRRMTVKELVKAIYTNMGFDPALVFVPGDDMTAIVKAIVQISKAMTVVSKGQMPAGLTDI